MRGAHPTSVQQVLRVGLANIDVSVGSNRLKRFGMRSGEEQGRGRRRITIPHGSSSGDLGIVRRDDPVQDQLTSPAEQQTQEALEAAQKALEHAEVAAENVEKLPSAREPRKMPAWLIRFLKPVMYAAGVAGIWYSHKCGPVASLPVALLVSLTVGLRGMRKGSLAPSGAFAAMFVGTACLGTSLRAGASLFLFYFSSSKLTTYCEDRKDFDEEFKKGGRRDWKQVFCNAFIPACLSIALALQTGGNDVLLSTGARRQATLLLGALLGYFSCCCGDTWASEVGQLSETQPRLITTLRPVRPGTNGGVTPLGLAASTAGGLFIGCIFFLAGVVAPALADSWRIAANQWSVIPLGLAAGVVGSLIDSLLGATIQFTGFNRQTGKLTSKYSSDVVAISGIPLLSNNGVNLVSASLTAILVARAAALVFV